tara:strand:- start:24342 stop:24557 length:216 start_codon:yes stop_codon:yes gene_type:complete
MMNHPDEEDIAILETVTYETLRKGCKECGFRHVVFQTCISVEKDVKVFFMNIECPMCKNDYTEIMHMKEIE